MPPFMYSQNQQYHQGATYGGVTHQPGMAWNGSSWVPQNQQQTSYFSHTTYATNTQTHQQQNAIQLQTQYTNYYHGWKAKEDAERKRAASLYGDAKQEAERQASWSKYYSEQASRAAHHYHNNPNVPFPHELPPAPPATISHSTPQQPSARDRSVAASTRSPNDAMKEYVHRSLKQCKGKAKEALQDMRRKVESMITQVCQDGTMHKIDWENKPLLPLPARHQANHSQTLVPSKYGGSSSPTTVTQPKTSPTSKTSQSGTIYSQSPSTSSYNGNYSSQVRYDDPQPSRRVNPSWQDPPHERYNAKVKGRVKKVSEVDSSYYGPSGKRDVQNRSEFSERDNGDLQENDSYYGSSGSTTTEDFDVDYIELPGKKRKKKPKSPVGPKRKKVSSPPSNGFQRNAHIMSKRASRFSGRGGLKDASSTRTSVDSDVAKYMGGGVIGGNEKLSEQDFEHMKVKGTCQVLEKDYFRLTAPPRAVLVRPPAVLEKHLQNLRDEWKRSPSERRDYAWFCSQLKAIRQDLTVQQVLTAFTVDVYECHARIALEEGDLNEFNQCQTQLKELYGTLKDDPKAVVNENEFLAYRLVYYVFLTGNKKYEEGSTDLFKIMLTLDASRRSDPTIAHALKIRESVADFNFYRFFRLYRSCPTKHGELLLKFLLPNVRQWALHRICKAYRPSVDVDFVLKELGFEGDGDGRRWLESCGCVVSGDELNTKDSVVRESDLKKQNSLI